MSFENAVPDRIIWVSADGDDNGSGARDAPLQSIQLAIDRATPGTAILIMPGEYSGHLEFEKIAGTPDAPIWLAAAAGPGSVTITAPNAEHSVITIRGEDNLVIRDLVLVGGFDGIEISQSGADFTDLVENIVVEGNTVIGAANDGIKVGQTDNARVVNNRIDGAGDQGIDLLGTTNSVVQGNEILNVAGSSGLFAKGGSSNLLIADNYIHDVVGDGLLVGGWSNADAFLPGTDYEAKNVVVTGNVVENAAKRPLTVRGAQDVDIHGNFFGTMDTNETVILIGAGSSELSPPPPSTRVSIHDNVFDRSANFTNIEEGSSDISIFDNVRDGVVEGDMRPSPPNPADGGFAETLPAELLDRPVWALSARPATNRTAGSGDQTLIGTDGHDFLSGGSGTDTTIGGRGDDTHSIGSSRDKVIENPNEGIDTVQAYVTSYTLPANVENLMVASSAGGSYRGNELNNVLKGGAGNDTLTGGDGDDLFWLPIGGGADVITDFGGGDRLDLRAFRDVTSLENVLALASEAGNDTVIAIGSDSITLRNVSLGSLTADDFLLVPAPEPVDVNEAPTDIELSATALAEGSALGTSVGTLSAVDPDQDESFTFSLLDDAEGRFAIDGNTLRLTGELDFETAVSHEVTVRVTDSAGNAYDETIVIAVENAAPDAPVDADEAPNEIAEGAGTGATVGVAALAGDINGGVVTYVLLDDAGGRFAIDPLTGVITVADGNLIDYETSSEHDVVVAASDTAGATSTSTFTVAVTNQAPTEPEDLDESPNEISENAAAGTGVGIAVGAADINGGAIAFSLIDDAGGRFAIDPETGIVTIAEGAILDFETATSHDIIVAASDDGGAASTSLMTIAVRNEAPLAPEDVDEAPNEVVEGAATGTAVGITAASAEPNGGSLTYALVDDADGRFAIDPLTGLVTVADGALLDFETAASHDIVVSASDGNGGVSLSVMTVAVANRAPMSPEDLDEAPNAVLEGAATGTRVGLAAAAADVNGGAISYALLDDAGGRFAIDAVTGVVSVADGTLIDFETATSHQIVVAATDAAGATSAATFAVAVGDRAGVTIVGSAAEDIINRGEAPIGQPLPTDENDTIDGNAGNDIIDGLGGDDTLNGGAGADVLIGGEGSDTASYREARTGIAVSLATGMGTAGDAAGDFLSGIENIAGTSFEDVIEGDGGDNILAGSYGADTASYAHAEAGVKVSLAQTKPQDTGGAGVDTLAAFENLTGSEFDDTLYGDKNRNTLVGLDGNDFIYAGAMDDKLEGGLGADYLSGSSGADWFIYRSAEDGLDTISDFQSGSDRLVISAAGFGGGLVVGGAVILADADSQFPDAPEGEGRFLFDKPTGGDGTLYWDPTGGASDDAVALALLGGGASLLATDFYVI